MALTALDIYKKLPQTNCGKCGFPTCLAFAMQLANKKASIDACPDVSDEAKELLESSAAPPIKLVKVGSGDREIEMGDEVVLHRHEKTFYHPVAYALMVDDDSPDIESKVQAAGEMKFERVGQEMQLDMIAIRSKSDDPAKFSSAVSAVKGKTSVPLALVSQNPAVIEEGLKVCGSDRPLIHAATKDNFEKMAELAKANNCPLAVLEDSGLEELAELSKKVKEAGVEDIVLDLGKKPLGKLFQELTLVRRLAIKKLFRPLGYPIIMFAGGEGASEGLEAAIGTLKYASIVVMKEADRAIMYPLFTLRQNIYTDPQKPIQVKPGIYELNGPAEDSPVMITTNFSLTYFTVAGDIETSKVPSYLLVADSEGLSVMTAFAADKFTADTATELIESCGIADKVNHKKIIIPGQVARMSGKLNENSGWEVVVGPRDSSGLPKYLREYAGA
ncbi:MAG: acetyl-CoA decarbonylase/synthase complex subunit gamma [Candidatus Thermoplasmatota archaeon]|nr:acetyl-CoA decarbonylase/synthase complex subunit gamma [Candidatus Thermoplasmatota archaeon]